MTGRTLRRQLANPVWHIHGGKPPESGMVVPFAMLLNLASVSAAEDKERLWGFIRRYAPEATPRGQPRSGCGGRIRGALLQRPGEAGKGLSRAERQGTRGAGGPAGPPEGLGLAGWMPRRCRPWFSPSAPNTGSSRLRDWFTALYEVLLGASQGPRFGGFIALYGVEETVGLIEGKLG